MLALRGRLAVFRPRYVARMMGGGHGHGHGDGHDDHHHHEPMMPPFARLPPPTSSMHEEAELVWDDGVAPEACIDSDAEDIVSGGQAFLWWLGGLGFFAGLAVVCRWIQKNRDRSVVPRSAILNPKQFQYDMGLISEEEMDRDEEERLNAEH